MNTALKAIAERRKSYLTRSRLFLSLVLSATALSFTGCETAEDRQLSKGQACLDNASTAADADTCIAIVEGMSSPSANLIRCSANFVAQGFTGSRLAEAFQGLKDNDSGNASDPMAKMMAYLVFSNTSDNHKMSTLITNCTNSGVTSMIRLATAANLATTIASLAAGGLGSFPTDAAQVEDAIKTRIADLVNSDDPTKNEQIGTIAQTANAAYCNAGSTYKDNEVCKNLEAAVNDTSGSAADVGKKLLELLQTNNSQ